LPLVWFKPVIEFSFEFRPKKNIQSSKIAG